MLVYISLSAMLAYIQLQVYNVRIHVVHPLCYSLMLLATNNILANEYLLMKQLAIFNAEIIKHDVLSY